VDSESSSEVRNDAADRAPPTDPVPLAFRSRIAALLRAGILGVATLLVAGLGLYFSQGTPRPLAAGLGSVESPVTLALLSASADPLALLSLGLMLLIALPVARVAYCFLYFLRTGDRLYAAVTAVVLVILAAGAVSGRLL